MGEEEKDAQRAALVQKQRQEKIDRENAQREAKRAADLKETMHYIQQQCADNNEREKVRARARARTHTHTAERKTCRKIYTCIFTFICFRC